MGKKRSPKEKIESVKRPFLETIWIKYPGEEMINVTSAQTIATVEVDMNKIAKIVQEHASRRLTSIHTHPNLTPFLKTRFGSKSIPSSGDFNHFLGDHRVKTMVIAQTNAYTGKLEGYGVYKKTKQTMGKPTLSTRFLYGLASETLFRNWALDFYADKFNINYRFVPTRDYQFKGKKFVKPKSSLEDKATSATLTAIVGIIGGFFFLSSNLTGNAISNLTQSTSNINGAVLFCIGLTASFFWLRKNLNSHQQRNN